MPENRFRCVDTTISGSARQQQFELTQTLIHATPQQNRCTHRCTTCIIISLSLSLLPHLLYITLEAIPKHNGNIGSHLNGDAADLISAAHRKQPSDERGAANACRPASQQPRRDECGLRSSLAASIACAGKLEICSALSRFRLSVQRVIYGLLLASNNSI